MPLNAAQIGFERTLEVWDALLGHAPAGTHTTPVR